jgi:translation initiation factor 1 (eIF-1/SUI1)
LVKQIHGLAQNLQIKFASSCTVQNLPGKNAGKEILLQGNFIEELESLLIT